MLLLKENVKNILAKHILIQPQAVQIISLGQSLRNQYFEVISSSMANKDSYKMDYICLAALNFLCPAPVSTNFLTLILTRIVCNSFTEINKSASSSVTEN